MQRAKRSILLSILLTLVLGAGALADDTSKGREAFKAGDYKKAVRLYTQALAKTPLGAYHRSRLLNMRGLAYKRSGDNGHALADFNKALEIDPDFPLPYNHRGHLFEETGKREQALRDFNRAIDLQPGYALAYVNRGHLWAKQNQHTKAVANFSMAVQINPEFVEAFINRGRSYQALAKADLALADFDQAIEVNPAHPLAYYHRALAHKQADRLQAAEADASRLVKLSPNDSGAQTLLTELRGLLKAHQTREDHKNPTNSRPSADPFKAALAAHRRGNHAEAIRLYTLDIESDRNTDSDLAVVYNNRGNAQAETGKLALAVDDYSEAVDLNPKYAMAYFNRAAAYHRLGKFRAAIVDYEVIQQIDPRWASVYMARSFTWESMGRLDLAINDLESHQSLVPGHRRVAERLAGLRKRLAASKPTGQPEEQQAASPVALLKAAEAAKQERDYDRVVSLATKSLSANPNSPATLSAAYFLRAEAYIRKGQTDKAVADYTRAATLAPRDAAPYLSRGNLWHARGNYKKAVADYTKAISLDPGQWQIFNARGNSRLQLGLKKAAIDDYSKALSLDPGAAAPFYNRAFAHWRQGANDLAAKDVEHFLKLAPDDRAGRQLLARLEAAATDSRPQNVRSKDPFVTGLKAYRRGDYTVAIEQFTLVIDDNKTPRRRLVEAFNNRGLCYRKHGDLKKALADYNRALNIMPDYDPALNNLGNIWLKRREYDQAITEFTRAIALNPNDSGYYFNRGLAWQQKGDADQAISDYNRSLELKPDFARAYAFRGIAYARKKMGKRALADYDRAAKLKPGLALVRYYRARLHLTEGRLRAAFSDAKAFVALAPNDSDGATLLREIEDKIQASS